MELRMHIGTATVRQVPFDFAGNRARIVQIVREAYKRDVALLLLPELALTGYGCEDNFTYPDFIAASNASLVELIEELKAVLSSTPFHRMLVSVGVPVAFPGGQVFNASALISAQGLHGFSCKQFLARNGVHYEPRWFSAWPRGVVKIHPEFNVPMGDVVFDCGGIRVGYETCEDSWVSNRPGRDLYQRNVDVILNPSASHFAVGKYQTRLQFIKEGSRAFGVVYAYANLSGCENGTSIFDAGCTIASEGDVVSAGARLTFAQARLNHATVSIDANRSARAVSSEAILNSEQGVIPVPCPLALRDPCFTVEDTGGGSPFDGLCGDDAVFTEICYAIANGLWDWHRRTRTSGFVISLSGGADSGLAAACVWMMYSYALKELGRDRFLSALGLDAASQVGYDDSEVLRQVMSTRLLCAYQGTDMSGDVTRRAAKTLADGLGATFFDWNVSTQVKGYIDLFDQSHPESPLTWEHDDIALQNIQARTRSPSIWLLANRTNKLLIATSNLSESALGYATMDGDTSGVLAPLSGLSKSTIRRLNGWLEHHGIPSLAPVNAQVPTAELRPGGQIDEVDLMPYEICDFIMDAYLLKKLWPANIFFALCRAGYEQQFTRMQLANFVEKWFRLFCRNPWKRYGTRAGFHLQQVSLDPKAFHRFPLLNSGFDEPIKAMWDCVFATSES